MSGAEKFFFTENDAKAYASGGLKACCHGEIHGCGSRRCRMRRIGTGHCGG